MSTTTTPQHWQETDVERERRHQNEVSRAWQKRAQELGDEAADATVLHIRAQAAGEAHIRRAMDKIENADMSDEKVRRSYASEVREAAQAFDIADSLQRRAVSRGESAAKVTHEPGPYDPNSPASWVADVLASRREPSSEALAQRNAGVDMRPAAVGARLDQHALDIQAALRRGGEYGRGVEAILREHGRQRVAEAFKDADRSEPGFAERMAGEHESRTLETVGALRAFRGRTQTELRAIGTDGGISATAPGEAAAFVPPAIALAVFGEYRSPFASFATACKSEPLPEWGLHVYTPQVTTGSTVTSQTEGGEVTKASPVVGLNTSEIVTKAGAVQISQELLDRSGPGISGDVFMFTQIKNQLDGQVDVFTLSQALSGASTVEDNGTFKIAETSGVGGFFGDLKKAKAKLADAAGVRLKATHCFAIPDLVGYIGAWADAQGRPILVPDFDDNQLPLRSTSDPAGEGFSGYVIEGCALFENANIPTVGTLPRTQVLVARCADILVFAGAPIPYVFPETYSTSLQAELGVREYVAVVAKHGGSAVATITGGAYQTANFA